MCFVAKRLNRSEVRVDFVVIQTCFSYVNHSVIMLTSFASLSSHGHPQYKGLVTFHTTVKWSIVYLYVKCNGENPSKVGDPFALAL